MATIINADTVIGGLIATGDASGELQLQSAGNTLVTLNGGVAAVTGSLTADSATLSGALTAGSLTLGGTDITSTAAELNILDGVTADAGELNKLDGVTVGTTEFNYLTGATGNIQPQINAITLTPQVITADTTASAGNFYYLDSAGITLTLPASPSTGDQLGIADLANDTTHTIAANGNNIMSDSADLTWDIAYKNNVLIYTGATVGWAFSG